MAVCLHGQFKHALLDDCVLDRFSEHLLAPLHDHWKPIVFVAASRPRPRSANIHLKWQPVIVSNMSVISNGSIVATIDRINSNGTIATANDGKKFNLTNPGIGIYLTRGTWPLDEVPLSTGMTYPVSSFEYLNVTEWKAGITKLLLHHNFTYTDISFPGNEACPRQGQDDCIVHVVDDLHKRFLAEWINTTLATALNHQACLDMIEQHELKHKITFDSVLLADSDVFWLGNLSTSNLMSMGNEITVTGYSQIATHFDRYSKTLEAQGLEHVHVALSTFPRQVAREILGWMSMFCSTCNSYGSYNATGLLQSVFFQRAPHTPEDFYEDRHLSAAMSHGIKISRVAYTILPMKLTKDEQRVACNHHVSQNEECMKRLERECPYWWHAVPEPRCAPQLDLSNISSSLRKPALGHESSSPLVANQPSIPHKSLKTLRVLKNNKYNDLSVWLDWGGAPCGMQPTSCPGPPPRVAFVIAGAERGFIERHDVQVSYQRHVVDSFNASHDSAVFLYLKNNNNNIKAWNTMVSTLRPAIAVNASLRDTPSPPHVTTRAQYCMQNTNFANDDYAQKVRNWWSAMKEAWQLVATHENSTRKQFDMLIFSRPDILYHESMGPFCAYEPDVWYSGGKGSPDHFWILPRDAAVDVLGGTLDAMYSCSGPCSACCARSNDAKGGNLLSFYPTSLWSKKYPLSTQILGSGDVFGSSGTRGSHIGCGSPNCGSLCEYLTKDLGWF